MKNIEAKEYELESLRKRLADIAMMHQLMSPETILSQICEKQSSLIRMLLEPNEFQSKFWVYVGDPQIIEAMKREYALALFREAIESPNRAYITNGHSVSPNSYHCYHRDDRSPTGVSHAASVSMEGPEGMAARALMSKLGLHTSTSRSYA